MQYRPLGKTGIKASILGFGAMRLPTSTPGDPTSIIEEEAIKIIRQGIDGGINYVDSAYVYHRGKSEVMVGKALKDGYREKVHIMTKNPVRLVNTTEDYRTLLDEELKRYDTEYIDGYLFHGLKKESYEQKILPLELIDEAKAAKKEGLIKHIGIANGARVVGNSLAKNPFPIFIPCHRAIRTNGELGGYQGGLAMKRLLLEMEGLKISDERKIITDKMYY